MSDPLSSRVPSATAVSCPPYPESTAITLEHRPLLHPLFVDLQQGISEFTFANIYLFRQTHGYRLSALSDGRPFFLGQDKDQPFFLLPFGLPEPAELKQIFQTHPMLKCASDTQAAQLAAQGYTVSEDRDNFDYLYLRQNLAELGGRNYHKKRNLIKAFVNAYDYQALPLKESLVSEALDVLAIWDQHASGNNDLEAAREALEKMEELQLCGGLYRVDDLPVAYVLGEQLAQGASFVIHFEKAIPGYKGLYQFINQSFASVLPEVYETINREQDLGDPGLRQAKQSYKPTGFVKKYKIFPPAPL